MLIGCAVLVIYALCQSLQSLYVVITCTQMPFHSLVRLYLRLFRWWCGMSVTVSSYSAVTFVMAMARLQYTREDAVQFPECLGELWGWLRHQMALVLGEEWNGSGQLFRCKFRNTIERLAIGETHLESYIIRQGYPTVTRDCSLWPTNLSLEMFNNSTFVSKTSHQGN